MKYSSKVYKTHKSHRFRYFLLVFLLVVILSALVAVVSYYRDLRPVSHSQQTQSVVIRQGASLDEIAAQLQKAGLIHSQWAFKVYVTVQHARNALQAGTYSLSPSESLQQIVNQLSHGSVSVSTVTILPGQRLDQVRTSLINDGFKPAEVDIALNPATYPDNPTLNDKPPSASLEGFLYPDTFQKAANTTASMIISQSLAEMSHHLTPDIRSAFAKQGLTTYQGIILASIVEQEVATQSDRDQAAQVFLKRLAQGHVLGSDVTARYGAIMAGLSPSITYDSAYNTLIHVGLPPTPISNVNDSSLRAVAFPAATDWLYFVTGDNGVTYFSKTFAEQQANTAKYCHALCASE